MADSEQKARRIDAGGDSNQSSKSVSQASRRDEKKRIKERDEEWGYKPSRGGIATEAKMGMMIIAILVLAFCFLVYHKFDLRQKELLAAQMKGQAPPTEDSTADTVFPLEDSVEGAVQDLQQAIANQAKPETQNFQRQPFDATLAANDVEPQPTLFEKQDTTAASSFDVPPQPSLASAEASGEMLAFNDSAPMDEPAQPEVNAFPPSETPAAPAFDSAPVEVADSDSATQSQDPDPFTLLMEPTVASNQDEAAPAAVETKAPAFDTPEGDSTVGQTPFDGSPPAFAKAEPPLEFAPAKSEPDLPSPEAAKPTPFSETKEEPAFANSDFSDGQFETLPLLEDDSDDSGAPQEPNDLTEFASLSEPTSAVPTSPPPTEFATTNPFEAAEPQKVDQLESFPVQEPGPSPFAEKLNQQPDISESPVLAMMDPPDVNVFERDAPLTRRAQPTEPLAPPSDDDFPSAAEPEAPQLNQPKSFDREVPQPNIEPSMRRFESSSTTPQVFDPPETHSKTLVTPAPTPEPELDFVPIEERPAVPAPQQPAPIQPGLQFPRPNSFETTRSARPTPARSYEPPRGPQWDIQNAGAQFAENSGSVQLVSGSTVDCDICEVRPKDTYWTISKRAYGTAVYFSSLALYNQKRIPDPKRLRPGMKVLIPPPARLEKLYPEFFKQLQKKPKLPTGFFVKADGSPAYRIGENETLSRIAQKHLGRASRWIQVYRMNTRVLRDPNKLKPGTVIDLPNDATNVQIAP